MKLHEYQSKLLFAQNGIPIPRGRVAATASEARDIANELGGRVVIKSQVLVGGRGKAGGIKLAKSASEAEDLATPDPGHDHQGPAGAQGAGRRGRRYSHRNLPGHDQ